MGVWYQAGAATLSFLHSAKAGFESPPAFRSTFNGALSSGLQLAGTASERLCEYYAAVMHASNNTCIIPCNYTAIDLINKRDGFIFSLHFTQIKYGSRSKKNTMSV